MIRNLFTRRAEAMAQHPSMQARLTVAWTPADAAEALADFERHADQAVQLTQPQPLPSRGVVVDLRTRRVIS